MSALTKPELRQRALASVVEEHRASLAQAIGARIRDSVEAEDVLQEVFEKYFEAYDLGTAIETLGSWLVTVAQNTIIDRFRRKKTRNENADELKFLASDISQTEASQPEDEFVRVWLRQEIAQAIELLPDEQRLVFVKHEIEGKSFEEIAKETGVGLNTLLSRKRYAVLFLREYLKEIYDELE